MDGLQSTRNGPAGLGPWFETVTETVTAWPGVGAAGSTDTLETIRSTPDEGMKTLVRRLFNSFVSATAFVTSTVAKPKKTPARGKEYGKFTTVVAPASRLATGRVGSAIARRSGLN